MLTIPKSLQRATGPQAPDEAFVQMASALTLSEREAAEAETAQGSAVINAQRAQEQGEETEMQRVGRRQGYVPLLDRAQGSREGTWAGIERRHQAKREESLRKTEAGEARDWATAFRQLYGAMAPRNAGKLLPEVYELLGADGVRSNRAFPFGSDDETKEFVKRVGKKEALRALDTHSAYIKRSGEANKRRNIIDFHEGTLKENEQLRQRILKEFAD